MRVGAGAVIPSLTSRHLSWQRLVAALVLIISPCPALAHGSEGSIVLLLPTGYYVIGAAIAVAASFLLLSLTPLRLTERLMVARLQLGTVRDVPHAITSTIAFLLLLVLVLAGFFGSRDPVANPLPSFVWTIWWVGFAAVQAVVGPLWPHLNPWTGPVFLLRRLSGGRLGAGRLVKLRNSFAYLIGIAQFSAFAWFELIDLAPGDPDRLALAVSLYWLGNLCGILVFGEKYWMKRAEPFSVLFGLIGRLSPFDRRDLGGRTRVALVWPGMTLATERVGLPHTAVALVLLALSAVSFDGLSRTFVWLGTIGINPLEFPGRSAVMTSGTLGMIAMFAVLGLAFYAAVAFGCRLANLQGLQEEAVGLLIYSIAPIALAYQASHHLTVALVDGQNFLIALSDPFALGWNLLGTADWRTTTSFLNTLDGVTMIFNSMALLIIYGHVVGIVMAHVIATRTFTSHRAAVISQIPLAVLMVFYTAFGLWLLSTPRI
jgi:hypothetical protein